MYMIYIYKYTYRSPNGWMCFQKDQLLTDMTGAAVSQNIKYFKAPNWLSLEFPEIGETTLGSIPCFIDKAWLKLIGANGI